MARIARIVAPGVPHHITQRGNRRQMVFFLPGDYQHYLESLRQACKAYGVEIWAYCLMPNHVHLIAVPQEEQSLRLAFADTHMHYTRMINSRNKWKGYLWQGRFSSCPMDEKHLHNAARYVELNPVRAGMCLNAEDYICSSARAHLNRCNDVLVNVNPLLERVPDWREFLEQKETEKHIARIRLHSRTGRPLASEEFIMVLEKKLGRSVKPQKRGRKPVMTPSKRHDP